MLLCDTGALCSGSACRGGTRKSDMLNEVFAKGVQQQQQPQALVGASGNSWHVTFALRNQEMCLCGGTGPTTIKKDTARSQLDCSNQIQMFSIHSLLHSVLPAFPNSWCPFLLFLSPYISIFCLST